MQNGSLEDLNGAFTNLTCSYTTLGNGNTDIAGWTVSTSSGEIAWAQGPTCDGYEASHASFFVDLSGLGSSSPDGALNQSLSTIGGVVYTLSIDLGSANNGTTVVTVGGNVLALTPGTPFVVGTTSWTPHTATFVGNPLDPTPLLSIANGSPGSDINLVDHISITNVPLPASAWLVSSALGLLGLAKRKQRTV